MIHFIAYRTTDMTAGANQTGGYYHIPFSHVKGRGKNSFIKSDEAKLIGSTAGIRSTRGCGYVCKLSGHYHFYAQATITNVEVLGKLEMSLTVKRNNDTSRRNRIVKTYDIAKELSGTSTNGVTYDVQADLELVIGDFVTVDLNFDNSGQDTFVVKGDTSDYKTFFTGYRIGR